MKLPITIDPRRHDAVLFDLDGALTTDAPLFGATVDLARKLQDIGMATAAYSSSPQCQRALKAAGVDDLFEVCIDGVAGERGTAENPDPTVLWSLRVDSVCDLNGVSSSRVPPKAWPQDAMGLRARHRYRRHRTRR